MPYDGNGVRCDIVMDPTSIISRMNIGRCLEIYFNASSRVARDMVRDILKKNPKDKQKAWTIVLEFLSIIDTEQYQAYKGATEEEIDEILQEIQEKELYVMYRVSSKKPSYLIVNDLENSKFKAPRGPINIPNGQKIMVTKSAATLAPLYTIVLSKTADDSLSSTSSAKFNHYGFPITVGSSAKNGLPWKNNPTRILSETEVRLYRAYGGTELIVNLKDRANSIETHKLMHYNILKSEHPGFEKTLVDRTQHPYGGDVALKILKTIFNVAGIDIIYMEDKESVFGPECDPRTGLNKR